MHRKPLAWSMGLAAVATPNGVISGQLPFILLRRGPQLHNLKGGASNAAAIVARGAAWPVVHYKKWAVAELEDGQDRTRRPGRGWPTPCNRVCNQLTNASFALRPRPAGLDVDLQRHGETCGHAFHRRDHDPPRGVD
ncbi:MAG: hypothetical protein ABSG53_02770 [Thermoguttaceae bacterium]